MIRVLVVDDSATMRRLIRAGVEADPEIEVIAEAATATEAREAIKTLAPDVLTLDIEMPGMDGLEFLERLMRARPMPVVMVSSLTSEGSDATIRALALGAVDFVEKPRFGSARKTFSELCDKLKVAARARVLRHDTGNRPSAVTRPDWRWNGKLVLIGSSTGGVEALEQILSAFPRDCPPTLVTQHMPAPFLVSFAQRLSGRIAPEVAVAYPGARPVQGQVFIAPGGLTHMVLDAGGAAIGLVEGEKYSGHRPSVDVMMNSAVPIADRVVATILTGMGRDGAEGMKALRDKGAFCIGQDEATSIVYGMPRVARALGGIDEELPLNRIAARILVKTNRLAEGTGG